MPGRVGASAASGSPPAPAVAEKPRPFDSQSGVRRAVDEESFSVRFTPGKPKSYWPVAGLFPFGRHDPEDAGALVPGRLRLKERPSPLVGAELLPQAWIQVLGLVLERVAPRLLDSACLEGSTPKREPIKLLDR
jgi:hypothetical protein